MPRPRAPTRSLFEHTGTRRCGGKFDVYRCKRCGVEILENAYRFAVHISVCKKATDEDRALAQQQLTKSKKGSNYQSPRNSLPGDVELAGLVASVRERAQSISGLNKDDITTRLLQQVASRFQQDGSFPERRASQNTGQDSLTPKRKALESQAEVAFPAESLLDSGLGGGREFYHVYSRDSRWDSQPLNHGLPNRPGQQRRAFDCEADLPQYNFGGGSDSSQRRSSLFSGGGGNAFAMEELAMADGGFDSAIGDGFGGGRGGASADFGDDLDSLVAAVTGSGGSRSTNPVASGDNAFSFGAPKPVGATNPDVEFERFDQGRNFSQPQQQQYPDHHHHHQQQPEQQQQQQQNYTSPSDQRQQYGACSEQQEMNFAGAAGWGMDNKGMTAGMSMRDTIRESMSQSANMVGGPQTFNNGFL